MKIRVGAVGVIGLLWIMALPVMAAKSKYTPLTKKYKNASLEQVLNDLNTRTGYTLSYVAEDLDLNQRVTMNFKDTPAKTVLKKVLDKNRYDITSKKNVITITLKPLPPTTYEVKASVPSEVQDDSLKTVRIWQDTTFSVVCKTITKELPQEQLEAPEPTSKGHYIQAFLGGGYSRVGYQLEGGSEKGGFGGLIQAQYAYFFHENWGVTAGVGLDVYSSKGVLNIRKDWDNRYDTDFDANAADRTGEKYTHRAEARNWTEKQLSGVVNIPIGVQCQYPINADNLRIYAGAGLKIGLPVFSSQQIVSGELQHTGYYPMWNLTLDEHVGNLGNSRDFYTEQASDFTIDQSIKTKMMAVAAMADVGVAIPVAEQIDIMVGAYLDYTINNLQSNQQELGWRQPKYAADDALQYREHAFMNTYYGMTAVAAALRPWQVGVKVGVQWHHQQKAQPAPAEYERIQTCDTTYTLAQRTDTTYKPQPEVANKIVRLMHRSVIWFDLDQWEPKLEPADILDRIADILRENTDQRILVNGHASKEGSAMHNQMLSDKRAQAVADMLIEKGVRPEQITTRGYSSEIDYVAEQAETDSSNPKHNISLDRRVEIIPVYDVEQ